MSELGAPADAQPSDDFATISDVPVAPSTDRVAPRQVATGTTRGIQQLGSDKVYSDGGNSQIIVADTVPQVLMGKQATFGEGFFVTRTGVDVTTNTDPTKLAFNSTRSFTVALQSSYTFASLGSVADGANATSSVVTIPHNVGFVPNVSFFSQKYLSDNPFSPSSPVIPTGYPLSKLTQVSMGDSVVQLDNATGEAFFQLWLSFDQTNLYLGLGFTNFTGGSVTASAITIYYTVFTLNVTSTS